MFNYLYFPLKKNTCIFLKCSTTTCTLLKFRRISFTNTHFPYIKHLRRGFRKLNSVSKDNA